MWKPVRKCGLPAVVAAVLLVLPPAWAAAEPEMVAAKVHRVLLVDDQPAVMLTSADEQAHLLVYVDHFMAQAIQMGIMGFSIDRPLTHDLIGNLLHRLGATLNRVSITELRQNTYYAMITLDVEGATQEVDARPSDALAIAVREKVPIFVARGLMTEREREGDTEAGRDIETDTGERRHGA